MLVSLFKALGLHKVIRLRFKDICEPDKASRQRDPLGIKLVIRWSGAFSSILVAFSVCFKGIFKKLNRSARWQHYAYLGVFECELYPKL